MSKTGANIQKGQYNHIALIISKSDLAGPFFSTFCDFRISEFDTVKQNMSITVS